MASIWGLSKEITCYEMLAAIPKTDIAIMIQPIIRPIIFTMVLSECSIALLLS
jgi:hypothetical protein